jgi:hypothetical protein
MQDGNMAAGLSVLGLIIGVYFLPLIVAASRKHAQTGAIALLNLLLGWTVLGWVAALIWAATNSSPNLVAANSRELPARRPSATEEIERYASLKERGMITEEEYEAKKRQLLGL